MTNVPRDSLSNMDLLIDRVDRLHTLPQVACEVLVLLQDTEFDVKDLVRTLEFDPALVTSILKLVNSSYYGISRNIGSLQQAVTYLGLRSLRLAVLGFGLLKHLTHDAPAAVYRDFWQRSLTMAAAATHLSSAVDGVRSDEAYSAGLLADLGVLVLSQVETERYIAIYDRDLHGRELT